VAKLQFQALFLHWFALPPRTAPKTGPNRRASLKRIMAKRKALQMRYRPAILTLFMVVFGGWNLAFGQGLNNVIPASPQVVQPVDETKLVRLTGNTHPEARPKFDQGLVAPNLPMERMLLLLRRSAEREAALEKFMDEQLDPTSPNFHRWLQPEEFGLNYGPAEQDIQKVTGWLEAHGFRVNSVSKGRIFIEFSGTADQVSQTFHTAIHRYVVRGEEHTANANDPAIPEALSPVVVGIYSLHNFHSKPLHRVGELMRLSKETGKWTPASPQYGITVSGNLYELITPYDFATIYNVLPLWNASAAIDGTGQNIAIVGRSDILLTDVATFRKTFGLPVKAPNVIVNGADPGYPSLDDQIENSLDVEWSGAVAKGATVNFVTTKSTATTGGDTLSEEYIIDHNVAPVMSSSYGQCELVLGTTGNSGTNSMWQQAVAQGITVFVAAGDQGSTGCDSSDQEPPAAAENGLQVNGLASTPYNVAVGGTDFDYFSDPSTYWLSTNNPTTLASAKGYIPEIPWNATCTNPVIDAILGVGDAEQTCNALLNDEVDLYLVSIGGGSGGKSGCTAPTSTTPSSCAGGYAKPSWQTGTGVPSDGKRDLPDVSLFAANGLLGSAYLICVSAASPDGTCNFSNTNDVLSLSVGGTSVSSPAMAGMMALVNQKMGSAQGNANHVFYQLAAKDTLTNCNASTVGNGTPCIFYDTTSGSNAMPCITGSPNCDTVTSGDQVGVVTGYDATTGYDLTTGLGSANATNLVNAWSSVQGTPTVTVSVATLTFPSTAVGKSSTAQTVTITNTGNATVTAPTISIIGADLSSFTQTNTCGSLPGAASCTISVTFKPAAAGTLTATLQAADNATGSPQSVTLTGTGTGGEVPVVSLTPASLTFPSTKVGSTSAAKVVTLKNTGGAVLDINSGGITIVGADLSSFTKTTTCGSTLAAGASCTISVSFKPLTGGALAATLKVADNAAGSPQSVTLTGTVPPPMVTLTPAKVTFPSTKVGSTSVVRVVTLKNTGGSTLTITSGGITISGADASSFTMTTTCGATVAPGATCTVSLLFKPLAGGTLTATLKVADNAAGSPQSVTLTGTVPPPAVALTPTTLTFPATSVGSTSTAKVVTLKNTGGSALTITSGRITISGADASSFTKTTTCGTTVAAGASCTISLSFEPAAKGTLTASLKVADNAATSPQAVSLTGTGN
jgi:hypothetical protein